MFIVAILASMIIEGICNFNIIKLPEEKEWGLDSKKRILKQKDSLIKMKGFI